jgi:hypothetical protein
MPGSPHEDRMLLTSKPQGGPWLRPVLAGLPLMEDGRTLALAQV